MKRRLWLFPMLVSMLLVGSGTIASGSPCTMGCQKEPAAPRAEFDRMQHDFGCIDRSTHTAEFHLTNTGNAPLVIVYTERSCHCIDIDCPADPIRPDETRTVTVRYTPDRKAEGTFSQYVRLFTNANSAAPLMLFLRGEVVR